MIISPNLNSVWISVLFDFSLFSIFFASFFARVNACVGKSLLFFTSCFGIIIMWPFEIGFMSRTAIASLFSSIFLDVISPAMTARKMGF